MARRVSLLILALVVGMTAWEGAAVADGHMPTTTTLPAQPLYGQFKVDLGVLVLYGVGLVVVTVAMTAGMWLVLRAARRGGRAA